MALTINLIRIKRRAIRLGVLLGVLMVLILTHKLWLPLFAQMLVKQDALQPADAIYVMDGGQGERVTRAVALLEAGYAPTAYATPQAHMKLRLMVGDTLNPQELREKRTKDSTLVYRAFREVPEYLSTFEEMTAILAHAKTHRYKRVILVSNRFHTARMHYVAGLIDWPDTLKLIITGADPGFHTDNWWQIERGLIFVNNECVKWVHYWWTYD